MGFNYEQIKKAAENHPYNIEDGINELLNS